MLRGEEDDETERSLLAVATLVDRARDGGMPVTLYVEGVPRRIDRDAPRICRNVKSKIDPILRLSYRQRSYISKSTTLRPQPMCHGSISRSVHT